MKIGYIDYFLDEWHANNFPGFLQAAGGGKHSICCAYAKIDSPLPGGRTSAQWSKDLGIPLCGTIDEVIDSSDALIVLSPNNSEMHEELCQLPLRSGKPTYVDKTFAPDGETARRLFALAEGSGTPCFTASSLRFAPEYQDIGRDGIQAISSWGPNDFDTYAIHQLEPIIMLMRAPASRVLYIPGDGWYSLVIEFAGGRAATVSGFMNGSPFALNVTGKFGAKVAIAEADFFHPFAEAMIAFFASGKSPVDSAETLMIMDILGAGERAQKQPGVWVTL